MYLKCLKKIERKLLDKSYLDEWKSNKNTLHIDYLEMERLAPLDLQCKDVLDSVANILSQILNISYKFKCYKEYNILALMFLVINKRHNNVLFDVSLDILSLKNLSVYVLDDFLDSKESFAIKSLIPHSMLFLGSEDSYGNYGEDSTKALLFMDNIIYKKRWIDNLAPIFGKSQIIKYIEESLKDDLKKLKWRHAFIKEQFLHGKNSVEVIENNLKDALNFWGKKSTKGSPVLLSDFIKDNFLNLILSSLLFKKYSHNDIDVTSLSLQVLKSVDVSDKKFLMFLNKDMEKFIISSGSNIESLFENHPLFLNEKIRKRFGDTFSDLDIPVEQDLDFKL